MFPLRTLLAAGTLSLCLSSTAQAGWFDDFFGGTSDAQAPVAQTPAETAAVPNVSQSVSDAMGMVSMVTDSLGVTDAQAQGGLGSIFNYVKGNVSADQFGQLASAVPGLDGLLDAVPAVTQATSGEGLGGLLSKAAEYSDSLQAVNQVSQQFEALGLKPEMITQFIGVLQQYLDTEQGQQAKQLLSSGLGGLFTSA